MRYAARPSFTTTTSQSCCLTMLVMRCLITGSSSAISTRLVVVSFNVMRNCSIGLVPNSDCVHKIDLGLVHRLVRVLLEKFAGKFEELVSLRQGSRSILQTSRSACGFKFAERNRHCGHAA